ncbi:uncharacterized protein LOC143075454 isoform X1 [Mytilus galloprovincialis]|uniref:uncharacterized protein LOC143075454 isoform X1 n=2 Tax=Mytilus galloprovincialis TaxID=29158 RepID=UPI003F7CC334
MNFANLISGFCIICGISLQVTDSRFSRNSTLDNYLQRKLQSITRWLDSRKDSTIFDYIYQVNYGMGLNLFQGDIKGYNPRHRTAVRDQTYLWNTRVIPYSFDPSFAPDARQDVLKAISQYHDKTCLRFIPRTDQYDYIVFKHISGCYSNIGRQGGPQDISLMSPCLRMGTAIHEMMHALGFWHEQSRPDRDSWVKVIFANIEKGKSFNFDKLSVDEVDTLGVQYDYGSIMHYSKYSFSKNGNPTIQPIRNTNAEIGQRDGLSDLDIKRINTLYRCDISIPDQFLPTTSKPTLPPQTQPLATQPTTKQPTPALPTKTTTQKPTTPLPTKPSTQQPTPPLPSKPTTQQQTQPTQTKLTTESKTPQTLQKTPTPQPTMKPTPTQQPPSPTTVKTTLVPTLQPTLSPTPRPTPGQIGWSSWSFYTPCDLQCQRKRYRFCFNLNSKYCPGANSQTAVCGKPCKPASYLGCWKINLGNLSIPSIEGKYPDLTDNYQARTAAVRKCADVASVKGYTVFALFDFGMCLTGPNAVKAFSQYGPSTDCGYRGKGGSTGISVYSFQKDIDGQYGLWTDWGQCTRTCGGGEQYRYRQCNNPPPIGEGAPCKGPGQQLRPCNNELCSTDAKCGVKYYMGMPGTSGKIHLSNYDNYMTCDYKIETVDANTTISLAFSRIDIEYSRGCLYDIMTIYDGPDQLSTPIGEFCGSNRPIPFESSSNSLYLLFQSDATGTAGGYTIEYTINSRTRKACTQIQQPAHSVAIGTSNFVGDNVVFVCDPGYRMLGTSAVTCVDQKGFAVWSDRTPFCIRRFKRSAYMPVIEYCNFEGNLCGFQNGEDDDLDWDVERTLNLENKQEFYLKTTSAKTQAPGDKGKIRSKVYESSGETCVHFSYRLLGNDNTLIKLYIEDNHKEQQILLWTGTANEYELWTEHKTFVFINNEFRIVFEYIVGETVYSSAEIDNITVKEGPC